MSGFILIFICLIAGFLLSYSGTLDRSAAKGINTFIIYVTLPAVSFKYLPFIQWSSSSVILVAGPILVWTISWLFVTVLDKLLKWQLTPVKRASILLVTGLCNTSFVGFPLISAYFGEDKLSLAVLCDQMTFLLLSTAALFVVLRARSGTASFTMLANKVFRFPPFLGTIAALALSPFIDFTPLTPVFSSLAGTVGPLALFSIGLQLRPSLFLSLRKDMALAVLFKLLVVPAILYGIVALVYTTHTMTGKITVFESAMPTLLSSSIVAEEYDLDTDFVNGTITLTILFGFVTTGLWYFVLA